MRTMTKSLLFLLFFGVAPKLIGSTPLLERTWGSVVQKIQKAGMITDPESRSNALREAIREGLLESDEKVRNEVFTFLSESVRSIDLRAFADILESYSRIDSRRYRALWLLDESALVHSSRHERTDVYRRAISEGRVVLPRGDVITRATALSLASLEGVIEIRELVAAFRAEALPEKADQLLPAMELRAGAADRQEGAQLAANRLAAMRDEDFGSRMKDDRGFREAVFQVAEDICAKDALSGRRDPNCATVRKVVDRQIVLERDERRAHAASSPAGAETTDQAREDWLDRLKDRVRY